MAKQYGGFMGGFRGKLGPAIGYMWNGRWCMRSRPTAVHNPRTEAQTEHREMFKAEVQTAAAMRWAVNTGLRDLAREMHMTAYNLFVHLNQPSFSLVDGTFTVDYPSLRLCTGPVAPVVFGEPQWTADNILSISFERGSGSPYDMVQLYVYCPTLGEGYLTSPVHRRTKHIAVALPDDFAGQEVHLYGMVQDDNGEWSETIYAGCITLARRQIEVVAAIIRDSETGRIFATQRGYGEWEGWWEFPGGKMEEGESAEEALRREIWEELETRIVVEEAVTTVEYDYPKFHLTMHCYQCRVESGSLTLKEHEAARWLAKEELDSVAWLPADTEVVAMLRSSI